MKLPTSLYTSWLSLCPSASFPNLLPLATSDLHFLALHRHEHLSKADKAKSRFAREGILELTHNVRQTTS